MRNLTEEQRQARREASKRYYDRNRLKVIDRIKGTSPHTKALYQLKTAIKTALEQNIDVVAVLNEVSQ